MKQLTILVATVNAVGHVNACTGALAPFLRRGHRVIFIIEAYQRKLTQLGFEEIVYQMPKATEEKNPGELMANMLKQFKVFGDYSVQDKFVNLSATFLSEKSLEEFAIVEGKLKQSIADIKPDLLWWDGGSLFPSVHYSGIPWVKNHSLMPICFIFNDQVPPSCSGFTLDTDPKEIAAFNELRRKLCFSSEVNDMVERLGYARYPNDSSCPDSQLLTVYACPEEINYPYIKTLEGWFNLEVFNKGPVTEEASLKQFLPASFVDDNLNGRFSQKWVFLSLGTMGSNDLDLMHRLTSVLAKTPHKYIVSKGPRHLEYSLPNNMWGDRYLKQTQILPLVDLVITHGGNNTVTETFALGKPMVVLPLFGDQFDNAQRLDDTGYGVRVDPYKFSESELLSAVEKLLYDDELNQKLKDASNRILSGNQPELLVEKVEELLASV